MFVEVIPSHIDNHSCKVPLQRGGEAHDPVAPDAGVGDMRRLLTHFLNISVKEVGHGRTPQPEHLKGQWYKFQVICSSCFVVFNVFLIVSCLCRNALNGITILGEVRWATRVDNSDIEYSMSTIVIRETAIIEELEIRNETLRISTRNMIRTR